MRWLCGFLALCICSTAYGSGFVVARFGGEHGHPTTDNPTALYYNPGAISLGSGTRLFVDGTLARRYVTYTRPEAAISSIGDRTPSDATSANAGAAELKNWAGSPFLGVATDFGVPKLGVAFGFYAPFGGGASWSDNTSLSAEQNEKYPGAVDGTQRWWSIDSSLKVIYFSAGASYQLHDKFHLGLSLNYVSSSIDTIRARNPDGTDDLLLPTGGLKEGRSYLNAKGGDLSLGVGFVYLPTPKLRVGYSYQSQPRFAETRLEGELYTVVNDGAAPAAPEQVDMLHTLPDIHRLGVSWRMSSQVELRLFADYVRWSVFERQCILSKPDTECVVDEQGTPDEDSPVTINVYRKWQDAFGVRGGGSYWLSSDVELYLGGGYDGNAATDEGIDPSLFDMDKFSVAVGTKISLLDQKLRLAFTYTQVIYMTREVAVVTNEAGAPSNPFVSSSNGPSPAGTYEQAIGVGNINLEYQF